MLKKIFKEQLQIELTEKQVQLFEDYFDLLRAFNQHTNLTRITDQEEVFMKHFLDSCMLMRLVDLNQEAKLVDLGSGAGFPGVPLLILNPKLHLTIVESQIKRVQFLTTLKHTLKLSFDIVHARAEIFAKEHQKSFDFVTARALGELPLILEMGLPLLKEKGYFLAPKGSRFEAELKSAEEALRILKSGVIKIDVFELPKNFGFRANILIQKNKHVEGYPREYARMKKKPL